MTLNRLFPVVFLFALSSVPVVGQDDLQGAEVWAKDFHSFSRPEEVVVRHIDLDLKVDFDQKRLVGRASLQIENRADSDYLLLDARELQIEKVTLGQEEGETETYFSLTPAVDYLGSRLMVAIEEDTRQVNVDYRTSPSAAALQWLEPEQTSDQTAPFLFTQSQAILARTWVPCQDTPSVRMTYRAGVQVPDGLMAVMSATNSQSIQPDGIYEFDMPQPVPSYLLALAVGKLEFREISARAGVYAEPSIVDDAAWELADTEKMIQEAEKLYGPYRWDRYDIIILPPSFPFGGMENPRLTFATPTILAGDRSLVALVAHELAHSWSGNLVTNATWNELWLNEGFTTYFEHRIMEAVYGSDYERMLAVLSYRDLQNALDRLGREDSLTALFLNLSGRDPDSGLTEIPYQKGHFFLRTLEEAIGRDAWDPFLRKYFSEFNFQSISTTEFLHYLETRLLDMIDNDLMTDLQVRKWLFEPGLPESCIQVESQELAQVDAQVQEFQDGTPASRLVTTGWTTHHWLYFLRSLPDRISEKRMIELDESFNFTNSGNSEILAAWLKRVIANDYQEGYAAMRDFLLRQGRRKFLIPIYDGLASTSEGLSLAREIYREARPMYHPLSQATVDQILNWSSSDEGPSDGQ